ncbi:hypothetical protein AKJ65_07880, partial [candidate division MSBL1 archaeon SCGC-AAA259E19]
MDELIEEAKILEAGKYVEIDLEELEEIVKNIDGDQIEILKLLREGSRTRKALAGNLGVSGKTVGRKFDLLKGHSLIHSGKGRPAEITSKGREFLRRVVPKEEARENVVNEIRSLLRIVSKRMDIGDERWNNFLQDGEKEELLKTFLYSEEAKHYLLFNSIEDFEDLSNEYRKLISAREMNIEEKGLDLKIANSIDKIVHKRKQKKIVGNRLEEIVRGILEDLKKSGSIGSYKDLTKSGKKRPDFIINGNIGIECKNLDPSKKNELGLSNLHSKIGRRFYGDLNWLYGNMGKEGWEEKILIIPSIKYSKSDKDKVKEIIEGAFTVFNDFFWISSSDEVKEQARKEIAKSFRK